MIPRQAAPTLRQLAEGFPVVAITGPRQAGKTTLVKATFPDKRYVSLEDPDERLFAEEDPHGFLARFPKGAILDEIQRCPALFPALQTRVDAEPRLALFVLTGSRQFDLLPEVTQNLAGRMAQIQLLPFALAELQQARIAVDRLDALLQRGFYPPLYDRNLAPEHWFANFVMTYLERDVRQLIGIRNLSLFQRFLKLCAARCGQLLNLSSLANDCGISHTTARHWLSVLETSYIAFLLPPHHRGFGKRLVKTPKLYFLDTGLATFLLGIRQPGQLVDHPARGALFESFVIGELLKRRYHQGLPANLYFWRNNTGDEIDVLIEESEQLQPVEIQASQTLAPDALAGLHKWLDHAGDLAFAPRLIHGGDEDLTQQGVKVCSWRRI